MCTRQHQAYHECRAHFLDTDWRDAVDTDGDDEYDDLYTGHPDREVRTTQNT